MPNYFAQACEAGDEMKAREMYNADNSVLNKYTGLKIALIYKHHSICRWLLSLPDIIVKSARGARDNLSCKTLNQGLER